MGTDLVIAGNKIELPPAQHGGFKALLPAAPRLPQYFPPGAPGAQLAAAILAEANKFTLAECEPRSVVKTAFNAAVLGLVPGDFLGMAHFVPFRDRKKNIVECQLIVGYKGWLELAYDSDFLLDVHSEVVLDGEEFARWNDENGPHIKHLMALDRDERLGWQYIKAAYCIWHSRGGGSGLEIVGRRALEVKHRRGNVWNSEPIAMCRKSAVLQAAKTWRRTRRIALASALEDAIDADRPQPALVAEADGGTPPPGLEAFAADDDDNLFPEDDEAKP